jgi:predicted O-methyltransferase YrrM
MVDSWEGEGRAYNGKSGDWHATLTQAAQDDFCARAKMRVKFAGLRANILRKRSCEAAAFVGDGSRDFVFIDADHSYEGCKADIDTWLPKLKPNGLIGGHDYQNPDFPAFGVTRAVDEFVQRHSLQLETGENFCWFVQLKGH